MVSGSDQGRRAVDWGEEDYNETGMQGLERGRKVEE